MHRSGQWLGLVLRLFITAAIRHDRNTETSLGALRVWGFVGDP